MSDLDQKHPMFTVQDAERIIFVIYGLRATAYPLQGERDANFHIKTGTGQEFVLKIAPAGEQWETLDLQYQALIHLAKHDSSLVLPRVCATSNGETNATITDDNGAVHFVRLLTYIPGKVFAQTSPHTPELLQSLGSLLGRIDRTLQGFTHAVARRELKWDLQHAMWIREYIHHIGDTARCSIVERFLLRFEIDALPFSASWTFIHLSVLCSSTVVSPAVSNKPEPRCPKASIPLELRVLQSCYACATRFIAAL